MKIRKATLNDLLYFFQLVNDPLVRNNSLNVENISLSDHTNWFKQKVSSAATYIYVAEERDNFIGQVRFDREEIGRTWSIDYSLASNYRGLGLGKELLKKSVESFCKEIDISFDLLAKVKKTNLPSMKVFYKLDFKLLSESDKTVTLTKRYDRNKKA